MTDRLFDPGPPLVSEETEKGEPISAGRRLTLRNAELLAAGTHPATGDRLFIGTGETCQTCIHRRIDVGHAKRYNKCARHRLGLSGSANSDIRVSWPACALYRRETDG